MQTLDVHTRAAAPATGRPSGPPPACESTLAPSLGGWRSVRSSETDWVGAEWPWVAVVAIATLILIELPFLFAYSQTSPDRVFVSLWAPHDYAQYGAAMREGASSASWLIHDHLTGEPHAPILMYTLYVGLGKIARVLSLDFELAYHLAEVAARAALLLAVYAFASVVLSTVYRRRLAFVLTLFTSGLAVFAVGARIVDAELSTTPAELNWPEVNTFLVLLTAPHLQLGLALLLLTARSYLASWSEWRRANRYYFDTQTMHGALLRTGFGQVRAESERRRYSLQHLRDRAHAVPETALTRVVKLVSSLVPPVLRKRVYLRVPTSATVVTARRVEQRSRPLLSIVMPVYNERASFVTTIEAVLRKQVAGIDKEIIVVESGSTDGTREAVRQYEGRPEVKVVLQDRPRGKGNAVREGFEHARGDFILIQDADQEYDVEDYDALLRPLQRYQRPFVLGSRHVSGWKIRQFNDQPGLVELCNLGHRIFLGLLNVIYRQDLKDPFTRYKVFWRDCLYDVHFECNRFDFDFELVIKLLRKGYRPLELPVTYRARSFRDGKKVSMLKDPLTWLLALAKYRFGSIYRADRCRASTTDWMSGPNSIGAQPAWSLRPLSTSGIDRPKLAVGGRSSR